MSNSNKTDYTFKSNFPLAENRYEDSYYDGCSFYGSAMDTQPVTMPWPTLVELIRDGEGFDSLSKEIREAYGKYGKRSEAYKQPKRRLPAVTPCAIHEGGRGYKFFRYATGKAQVDLDEVADEAKLAEMIRRVDNDPHTFLRYITPSGHGLRIIVKCEVCSVKCEVPSGNEKLHTTNYTLNYYNAWKQVNEYYSSLTECPYDKCTKDITHLSFLAHDPTAYFNEESELFTVVTRESLFPQPLPREGRGDPRDITGLPLSSGGGIRGVRPESDVEVVERIMAHRGAEFCEGNRNNYIHLLLFLLCKKGVPEGEALTYVQAHYPGFEEREMPAHVRRVYAMPGLFGSWEERRVKYSSWMKPPVETGRAPVSNPDGTVVSNPDGTVVSNPDGTVDAETGTRPVSTDGQRRGRPSSHAPVQDIIDWLVQEYNLPSLTPQPPLPEERGRSYGEGSPSLRGKGLGDEAKRRKALPNSGLRWNCITHKVEVFDIEEQRMVDLSNRQRKSLWVQCSVALGKKVAQQDFNDVCESYIVPLFNPFQAYFDSLKPWDGKTDHIARLASRIKLVETGRAPVSNPDGRAPVSNPDGRAPVSNPDGHVDAETEPTPSLQFFERCFRKWFVGMIASWLDEKVVNELVLVLIGKQGRYKSKFFQFLLPPELNRYFLSKTNATRMNKDEKLALSEFALISMEEIDSMRDSELNQLKALVTTAVISERAAYERAKDNYVHIASFCATGNKKQFLTDLTGNRRWLPFEVESILSPFDNPIDYEGLYAQGYALLQQGFQYWMTADEGEELAEHQKEFETPSVELEGIFKHFRKPIPQEGGLPDPKQQWMSCSEIANVCGANFRGGDFQQYVSRISLQMNKLGFQRQRKRIKEGDQTHQVTGFYVVPKDADEQSYDNESNAWRR